MKKTSSKRNNGHKRAPKPQQTPLHFQWQQKALVIKWLPEPNLLFANGSKTTDPKEGLSLYGPYGLTSGEHPDRIRVGFVGTEITINQARVWIEKCVNFISGVEGKRRQFPDFPGFNSETAFQSNFAFNPGWQNVISQRDLAAVITAGDKVQGFESAVELFSSRVMLLSDLHTIDLIICALPEEIEEYYTTIGPDEVKASPSAQLTPFARAVRRVVRAAEARGQTSFLGELFPKEISTAPGLLNRNFRRALKAKTNHANCPVQILRQRSLVEDDPEAQDPASRAWNMVVGMYFKARGMPWQVEGLDPNTCYIGISFYHHITAESHTVHSSLAQLFTAQGDSLVLRGEKFEWNPDTPGRSPHLTAEYAKTLVERILDKYYEYKQIYPRRIVIHKTSKYYNEELSGLTEGLNSRNISQYDLIALNQTGIRFFREGDYPPVRGTWCRLGHSINLLYTLGYFPSHGTYPRSYVPKPVQIVDKHGDSTAETLLREILALTKMNWNSADYAGANPITLSFARKVGEIMSYLPDESEPNPNFRFYC